MVTKVKYQSRAGTQSTKDTTAAHKILVNRISEKEFQDQIIELARYTGYLVYHDQDSRRSEPGFPDLVLVGDRVMFLEVKRQNGVVSEAQKGWIARLVKAGIIARVVRPSDWDWIQQALVHGDWRG